MVFFGTLFALSFLGMIYVDHCPLPLWLPGPLYRVLGVVQFA